LYYYFIIMNKLETNLSIPMADMQDNTALEQIDPLQMYLSEINRYSLLTREEEDRLTKIYYETRDPVIASRIVTANLRLVVKIALDFQKFWMRNFMDLIQEGSIGLIQAVRKFDPYKGVKFSYYSSFWIKAYILKFIMDNWRLVKIGTTQAQRKLFYNLNKERERIAALGFKPVPKLISEGLGVSEQDVIDMEQRMGSYEVSLDAPVEDDSENTHLDFLPSLDVSVESRFAKEEMLQQLRKHLADLKDTLKGKEKIIFERRMLADEPVTLQELGEEFGVSRERVRQIESRLKKKVRQFLKDRIKDIEFYPEGIEEA
ncbi:MAG: sigma-70 family RNA polymerase sigma factor, partial [Dissulfurimicrobium sp.]|uniref:sigma-70 family RNA polymerase sigma factor n=3 Tax=Dissulfurimicrobium sp. TaxID=2022436 RepID=UPI00404A857B